MPKIEHLTEEELALYVDGFLLHRFDSIPKDLREHVEACQECKQAIAETASIVPADTIERGRQHPFFSDVLENESSATSFPYYRIAAGILFLVGTGIALYLLHSGGTTNQTRESAAVTAPTTNTTVAQPVTESRFDSTLADAGSFAPFPLYEQLCSQAFRSISNGRYSPANGDTLHGHGTFSWTGGSPSQQFDFSLYGNKGQKIERATVAGDHYVLTQELLPGRYYWKLAQDGELLFAGKFFVLSIKPSTSR